MELDRQETVTKMKEITEVKEWAELVANYYRELVGQSLPNSLIEKLVVGWQDYMLFLVKSDEDSKR